MTLLKSLALAASLLSVATTSVAANLDISLDSGKRWQQVNAGDDGWGDGSGSFSFSGETAEVTVKDAASNPWHIQLKRPKVKLNKGEMYKITAQVSASAKSPLTIIVQKDSGDYATYYAEDLSVSPSAQTFNLSFKAPSSDSKAAFAFFVGGAAPGVTFTFKDIRLVSEN
ncbi:carbohydrate binding domain-containing protein [Agarivorans sp. 1_MG-2023]|uniref:carbohydrate binding domain-containing protein n=1 Tax=Agarivorans sp. 1_MG-2023 TaxID=3062634 RepID=UPI0026E2087F|nr:carbohydrate binding domain-containing protein [Agarivorans sp. 1_MG-2023]MDO6763331.1 carbohydrate binding domain-containing protein [Agarivorans sp. 1_MG-2023]